MIHLTILDRETGQWNSLGHFSSRHEVDEYLATDVPDTAIRLMSVDSKTLKPNGSVVCVINPHHDPDCQHWTEE